MTPGRIPWRDVVAWCAHHDLDIAETAFVDACILGMDEAYLEWHSERTASGK